MAAATPLRDAKAGAPKLDSISRPAIHTSQRWICRGASKIGLPQEPQQQSVSANWPTVPQFHLPAAVKGAAYAAMRVYNFLHCRPSIWQNRLDAGHFASGQLLRHLIGVIHRRTQRLAWFEMGHAFLRNIHWFTTARVAAHAWRTVHD